MLMVMVLSPRAWPTGPPRPGAPEEEAKTSPSSVDSCLPSGLLEVFTLSQDWGLLRAGSLHIAQTLYDRACGQAAPPVRPPHLSPRLCPNFMPPSPGTWSQHYPTIHRSHPASETAQPTYQARHAHSGPCPALCLGHTVDISWHCLRYPRSCFKPSGSVRVCGCAYSPPNSCVSSPRP